MELRFQDSFCYSGPLHFHALPLYSKGTRFLAKRERKTDVAEGTGKPTLSFLSGAVQHTFSLGQGNFSLLNFVLVVDFFFTVDEQCAGYRFSEGLISCLESLGWVRGSFHKGDPTTS